MEFTVPQFIEREAKIVGPLTFKQFIFVGTAGGLCFFLFFLVPLSFFLIVAAVLLGGALALAFLKIGKVSLPIYIKNFFIFLFKPKIYLWQKKAPPIKIIKKAEGVIKEEQKKESTLKIGRGSKLNELFTRLETKPR